MKKHAGNRRRFFFTMTAAIILIAIGFLGIINVYRNLRSTLISYQDELILSKASAVSQLIADYIKEYSETVSGLPSQNRSIEAEREYFSSGHSERILRVLQFHLARQGGRPLALAVFDSEGGYIVGTNEADTGSEWDKLDLSAGESGIYLATFPGDIRCLVFTCRSEYGLYYCTYVPLDTVFLYCLENYTIDENSSLLLLDSGGSHIYYADSDELSKLSPEDFSEENQGLSIREIILNSAGKPNGYSEEIYFSHKGSPRSSLIGSIAIRLTSGSLYTIATLELNDVVAPVRSGVALLSFCVILLLSGIFLVARHALYARRVSEEAIKELLLLKEKSRTLEDIHRKEQEISHNLRLQELGAVTSGIAHEFNNLLTPIMGYSSMLLETLSPEEENYENVIEIYTASEKAKDTINKISYLSRKNMDLTFKHVEIDALVHKTISVSMITKNKNIEVEESLGCQGVLVSGNETLLGQMLLNLYINAGQAMEDSGGVLTVKTYLRKEKTVVIEVGDTGRGLDKGILDSIFEPFFTTKETGKGTGLGLSIAKRVVEGHDGTIEVKNKANGGALFTVSLPAI